MTMTEMATSPVRLRQTAVLAHLIAFVLFGALVPLTGCADADETVAGEPEAVPSYVDQTVAAETVADEPETVPSYADEPPPETAVPAGVAEPVRDSVTEPTKAVADTAAEAEGAAVFVDGHDPIEPALDVTPEEEPGLSQSLAPTRQFGEITVSAHEEGTVLVDGKPVGTVAHGSELVAPRVEVGERQVVVEYWDGTSESVTGTVVRDESWAVVFSYIAPPPLEIGVTWVNSFGMSFAAVPAGSFHNGSSEVSLSGFWMGQTPVTQSQWEAVLGTRPSASDRGIGPDRPVNTVSWYEAIVFCNRLSLQEGLEPVYSIGGEPDPRQWGAVPSQIDERWERVVMNLNADGYRLPTQAEWEYAATGGPVSAGFRYVGSNNISDVAWYLDNSSGVTQVVRRKRPNELGLYDMNGNVWEWVWDRHGRYPTTPQLDPTGPEAGTERVLRGGSFADAEASIDIHTRIIDRPYYRYYTMGFRIARSRIR